MTWLTMGFGALGIIITALALHDRDYVFLGVVGAATVTLFFISYLSRPKD